VTWCNSSSRKLATLGMLLYLRFIIFYYYLLLQYRLKIKLRSPPSQYALSRVSIGIKASTSSIGLKSVSSAYIMVDPSCRTVVQPPVASSIVRGYGQFSHYPLSATWAWPVICEAVEKFPSEPRNKPKPVMAAAVVGKMAAMEDLGIVEILPLVGVRMV
jgi:hypothetical protein